MITASERLASYLALECLMVRLDQDNDPLADELRDVMDPIWYAMTDEDHALLDTRGGVPAMFAGTVG